jgi:hypothetical protein
MNSTSAGATGGNVGRVSGGSDLVGCPGAPGWTTTGVAGSCAATESDNKHTRAQPAIKQKGFIGPDSGNIDALTLSQSRPNFATGGRGLSIAISFASLRLCL